MSYASTEPDAPPSRGGSALSVFLRAPFAARTWREALYCLVAGALGVVGIGYLYVGVGGGLLLSLTVVGIPILAAVVAGGRAWGALYRALGGTLLGSRTTAPPPLHTKPGVLGFIGSWLTDRAGWRGLAFVLVKGIVGPVLGYLALVFSAMSVFTAISPIPWVLVHPTNIDEYGNERHSMFQFGSVYFDTWPKMLAASAVGVVACFLAPWPIRAIGALDRFLISALLGPTARDTRVHELETTRAAAVEDASATLARLERDLHDGTQARLVTIAMALGRAEDRIAHGGDAAPLIEDARTSAKEGLAELRELVRGIHPPALDLGLAPALETLAARSPVRVDLDVALATRPSRGTETIAYFSAAELLTNVVKHAGTGHASLTVRDDGATLVLTVRDDGAGGADPATGTGLAGLASRAATVDGSVDVSSPSGGPTVVTVTLPHAAPEALSGPAFRGRP
ncbi:sensor domain-containing protein [Rhodococcus sp. HNM0569]|uniref:sensor histidine kinase n=1 Tax=Rhodococcus sp. HNM0569 TaxID=2716340 RepID=UPI00146A7C4A|nr:sensor domain-containing protein [Rhodococcus sp. HNM0569]NLU83240.1 sensor histidine kinase [Rhodococcus sp. HNM0569]